MIDGWGRGDYGGNEFDQEREEDEREDGPIRRE
jgi:hypothetical protein